MWLSIASLVLIFFAGKSASGQPACYTPAICDGRPKWLALSHELERDIADQIMMRTFGRDLIGMTDKTNDLFEIAAGLQAIIKSKNLPSMPVTTDTSDPVTTKAVSPRYQYGYTKKHLMNPMLSDHTQLETVANSMTQHSTGNDITVTTEIANKHDDNTPSSAIVSGNVNSSNVSTSTQPTFNKPKPTVAASTNIIPSTTQSLSPLSIVSVRSSVRQTTTITTPVCEEHLRRGGCIWTVVNKKIGVNLTFDEGVKICKTKRSIVAPITNDENYHSALKAVRVKMLTSPVANVWINGTIGSSGGVPNDSCNPFRKWHPDYRNRISDYATNLLLHADSKPNRNLNGMIKKMATFKANGVVCFFRGDEMHRASPFISPYDVGGCCKTSENRDCFWTELHDDITFNTAKTICSDHSSFPAVIPDEKTYNAIMNDVREKNIGRGVKIWTGMTFNAKTNTTSPENAFYNWQSGLPEANEQKTSIDVFVSLDGNSNTQGMGNTRPNWLRSGVVCQKENTKRGRDETVD